MLERYLRGEVKMKTKTALMIDSSIIRQTPKLNSPLFKQIIKYTRIGVFNLYISEIIEKEYLTWIQKEAQDAYDSVDKASKSLNKFFNKPKINELELHINMTACFARNEFNETLKSIIANWNKFKEETNVTIVPIGNGHGKLVMDAYFDGSAPFKSKKNRSDIPDAFIYYSLLDLLREHDKVIFVSQDKEFCDRISNKNITVFNNLAELFNHDEYKLSEKYFNELPKKRQKDYLFQYYKDEIIKKARLQIVISDLISDLENEYRLKIIGNYKSEFSSVESIQLDYNKINNISPNTYLVPFSAKVEYTVSSEATKEDLAYFSMERVSNLKEKNFNDNGLYDISEVITTLVSGNASVDFAETNPMSWEEKETKRSFFEEMEISEITVNIENIEKSI